MPTIHDTAYTKQDGRSFDTLTMSFLYPLSLLLASAGTSMGHTTNVQVPANLATRALVRDVYGYSVEPVWLNSYVNSSLMATLLQGITGITGKAPPIRIGGTTSDETYLIESLPGNDTSVETTDPETWNVTAAWYPTFADYFPEGTEFVYCLNFADNSSGWANAQGQARAAWEALGEQLVLFELGNEIDVSSSTSLKDIYSLECILKQTKALRQQGLARSGMGCCGIHPAVQQPDCKHPDLFVVYRSWRCGAQVPGRRVCRPAMGA